MVTYALQVGIVWLLLLMVYVLFLKKETHFNINRAYLIFSLLAGIGLPLLSELVKPNEAIPSVNIYLEELNEIVVTTSEVQVQHFDWNIFILFIYLIGVGVTSFKLIYGLVKILKLYLGSKKSKINKLTIVNTNKFHLPFSFFNAIFISNKLPLEKHLEEIIHHESCHSVALHSLDILFIELLNVIFWFNPILWIYKSEVKACHEYEADRVALKFHSKEEYSMLLIGQSTSGIELALSNQFFNSLIKNRVKMMYKKQSDNHTLLKYLVAAPLILVLLYAFSPIKEILPIVNNDLIIQDTTKNEVYEMVEIMPEFPESEQYPTLADYFIKNLKYPSDAKKNKIEGKVFASFTISDEGKMKDVKIKKGAHEILNEESLSFLKKMSDEIKWIPGKIKNKNVHTSMTLPVQFKLDEKELPAKVMSDEKIKMDEEVKDEIVMPLFPGSKDQDESVKLIMKFLMDNLKYPKEAKEKGIEGRVILRLDIDKSGKISESTILKSLDVSCDAEVNRIVELLKLHKTNWTPGLKNGNTETVSVTLPVVFKLEKDKFKVENFFTITPNPANNFVTISTNENLSHDISIEIFDQLGAIKSNFKLGKNESKEINIMQFIKGTYHVKAVVNNEVVTKTFIKN